MNCISIEVKQGLHDSNSKLGSSVPNPPLRLTFPRAIPERSPSDATGELR